MLAAPEQIRGPSFDKDTSAEAYGLRNTMMSDWFVCLNRAHIAHIQSAG